MVRRREQNNGAEKRTNGAEKRTNGAEKRKCTLGPPYCSIVMGVADLKGLVPPLKDWNLLCSLFRDPIQRSFEKFSLKDRVRGSALDSP